MGVGLRFSVERIDEEFLNAKYVGQFVLQWHRERQMWYSYRNGEYYRGAWGDACEQLFRDEESELKTLIAGGHATDNDLEELRKRFGRCSLCMTIYFKGWVTARRIKSMVGGLLL